MVRCLAEADEIEKEYEDKFKNVDAQQRTTPFLMLLRHQLYKIKASRKDLLPLVGYAYNNGMLKKLESNGERGTVYIYKFPNDRYEKIASD